MTIAIDIIGRVDELSAPTMLPFAAGEVRAGFPSPADGYKVANTPAACSASNYGATA